MQVILLERIENLGAPGSEVSVKRGYARNWLLPQGKAVLANEKNRTYAKTERVQITARDVAKRAEAESVQRKLDGKEVILVRAAGERGQLYGSVRTQDIAEAIEAQLQIIISKKLVSLEEPVRSTGIFSVPVRLHPQVPVAVSINVAPSEDEAKRQALKRDQARQKAEQEESRKEARKETKSARAPKEEKLEEEKAKAESSEEDKATTEENSEEKTQAEIKENIEANAEEEIEDTVEFGDDEESKKRLKRYSAKKKSSKRDKH